MNTVTLKNLPYQVIFRCLLFIGGLSFIADYILHFFNLSLISSATFDYGDGSKIVGRGTLIVALCLYCILAFSTFNGPSKKAKHFRTYFLVAHSIFSLIIINTLTLQNYHGFLIPHVKDEFLWTAYLLITWYFLIWIFWFLQKYEWSKK
jgi:hypothetical protein